ncbi:MAG: Response regulatory protein [Anaerolineales bacterium]|nr:Response regulatory protein [Anaerolineales bacterium]MBM2849427.1 Response regulatory protein [Anaerolineales bacterium]
MTVRTGPILVVEDIAHVRDLIAVQLRLRGYTVVTARDGQEALELIAQDKPAIVISDILMPRVDGFALAHKIRSDPQTAGIPLLLLSATYVSAEDERFALGVGAIRFLPKPVEGDDLLVAVADALTGQTPSGPPMSEREFYINYRQRLKTKLQQKAQQIARTQQQLDSAAEPQRETYRHLLAEAQEQYDEIQRELSVLANVLQEVE